MNCRCGGVPEKYECLLVFVCVARTVGCSAWRRRRFEQDAILGELIRNSGLELRPTLPQLQDSRNGGGDSGTEGGVAAVAPYPDDGPALYPVPQTVPRLPETFSPRPTEYRLLLDELLGRASGKSAGKVLAYGMGACDTVAMRAQPSF